MKWFAFRIAFSIHKNGIANEIQIAIGESRLPPLLQSVRREFGERARCRLPELPQGAGEAERPDKLALETALRR